MSAIIESSIAVFVTVVMSAVIYVAWNTDTHKEINPNSPYVCSDCHKGN